VTSRTDPSTTKLVICARHAFSEWNAKPLVAESLRQRWPQMKVVHLPDYQSLATEIPDTDIYVGSTLKPAEFLLGKKLKWVHSTSAGVGQLMYPEIRNSEVTVTNASGVFSVPMAEHTIGLLLAMTRNILGAVRQQDREVWSQQQMWDRPGNLSELNGAAILIVGYGSIGREIGKRAKAMGMRVWGVTKSGRGDDTHADKILPSSGLQEALPEADFVVLCAPATEDTKAIIGAEQLRVMKRGARIVNLGRGSLLNEVALLGALKDETLAGAALDVTETEPLPTGSPLWHAPNLMITPHTSAVSERLWHRQTALLIDLLERWFDGRELSNRVDLERGY
jgi:phosphoglycerate dehydrogenase-like enzyme